MKVSLDNNDNSFDEEGFKDVLSILKTKQYDPKIDYPYGYYYADYYHQCHDIEKNDEEDFKKNNTL